MVTQRCEFWEALTESQTHPVLLRERGYLRVAVTVYLQDMGDGSTRLKVRQSSYQYQADPDGQQEFS